MASLLPLKTMSRDEKLHEMEAIWEDLSRDESQLDSPAWHETALRDAEHEILEGRAKFSDWEEAKIRFHQQTDRQS